MRSQVRGMLAACLAAVTLPAAAVRAEAPSPGAEILQNLRDFQQMGSVLMVAAHPDDENTQLLTYLARGRHYRTGYLSITRGDGGQNLLGPEFGEELGVIRTQELLAARRVDGAQQSFTRAIDFGFSKDYQDTLRVWGHEEVLSDVVRVIREFRPDVIVTRFSTQPGNTHGHHTASAVLALEAFTAAADAKRFPEQHLPAWQAKRIVMNRGFGGGAGSGVQMDISGTDALTGMTFGELAGISRGMHKTQGFGRTAGGGVRGGVGGGPHMETFTLLAGESATKDIMDGVETTWGRVKGGDEVGRSVEQVIADFDANHPAANLAGVLGVREKLSAVAAGDPVVDEKRQLLNRIVCACAGLTVRTTVENGETVPGEMMKLRHVAEVTSDVPVTWLGVEYPGISKQVMEEKVMKKGEASVREFAAELPANTPVSQPYWLRDEAGAGRYTVADAAMIGRPENLPAFPIKEVFVIGGQRVTVTDEPVKAGTGDQMQVVPPVTLTFDVGVRVIPPGESRSVFVELKSSRAGVNGTLHLEAPAGWKVEPASGPISMKNVWEQWRAEFHVTAPPDGGVATLMARAEVNGRSYSNSRVEIRYPHLPPILLQPTAQVKAVSADVQVAAKQIGYLPGAGDSVAECLEQMGCTVTRLKTEDLTAENLKQFDAVVVGIRAFNVRADLREHVADLEKYAEAGGNVVVQYQTPGGLVTPRLTPYMVRLSGDLPKWRVTDETAPVTLLAPESPVFNTPNKIGPADWEGWVQERGLDFASDWDKEHVTPLLACSDPGEEPLKGGLLVADYGKGHFVYTGLAFFRQLPAGVPGAYRLFANLVSLGK